MKVSRELSDTLEAITKEVDSWPASKRSIDVHGLKKKSTTTETPRKNTSDTDGTGLSQAVSA